MMQRSLWHHYPYRSVTRHDAVLRFEPLVLLVTVMAVALWSSSQKWQVVPKVVSMALSAFGRGWGTFRRRMAEIYYRTDPKGLEVAAIATALAWFLVLSWAAMHADNLRVVQSERFWGGMMLVVGGIQLIVLVEGSYIRRRAMFAAAAVWLLLNWLVALGAPVLGRELGEYNVVIFRLFRVHLLIAAFGSAWAYLLLSWAERGRAE